MITEHKKAAASEVTNPWHTRSKQTLVTLLTAGLLSGLLPGNMSPRSAQGQETGEIYVETQNYNYEPESVILLPDYILVRDRRQRWFLRFWDNAMEIRYGGFYDPVFYPRFGLIPYNTFLMEVVFGPDYLPTSIYYRERIEIVNIVNVRPTHRRPVIIERNSRYDTFVRDNRWQLRTDRKPDKTFHPDKKPTPYTHDNNLPKSPPDNRLLHRGPTDHSNHAVPADRFGHPMRGRKNQSRINRINMPPALPPRETAPRNREPGNFRRITPPQGMESPRFPQQRSGMPRHPQKMDGISRTPFRPGHALPQRHPQGGHSQGQRPHKYNR